MWLLNPYRFGRLWTPADITTALWLDADDASTVTTVSGAVSQWNDKSGNARHATQSNPSWRPAYTNSGLNSKNVVTFDGANDLLTFPSITLDTNNTFVFSVHQRIAATNYIDIGSSASGYGNWWFTDNVLYSRLRTATGAPFGTHGGPSTSTGNCISCLVRNSLGTQAWRNGTALGTRQQVVLGENVNIGQIGATGTNISVGYIAEIILGRFDLSDSTRQFIEGYLAHKWGLTANLPNDHPFKGAPPTI